MQAGVHLAFIYLEPHADKASTDNHDREYLTNLTILCSVIAGYYYNYALSVKNLPVPFI